MLIAIALAMASPAAPLAQFRIRSHFGHTVEQRLSRVAAADDVDQDGVPDYIVSGAGFRTLGEAKLISGATGAELFAIQGTTFDLFGHSACGLGDVNGDGTFDFAIGAPGTDTIAEGAGRVYVYSGADGSILRMHNGAERGASLGTDIARAGDVDGDGVDDLVCCAPRESGGGLTRGGSVRVYSGATGALLQAFFGDVADNVSAAGDVDGDGFADILVGSLTLWRVRVYSGRTGAILVEDIANGDSHGLGEDVCALGDVNGDGFDDFAASTRRGGPLSLNRPGLVRVYAGPAGAVLYDIYGTAGTDDFGSGLSRAGDWNGDGVQDLAVRALNWVEIRSGADGTRIRRLLEPYYFNVPSRNSLAGPGDLDGDGLPDLLVGHSTWDNRSTLQQDVGLVMVLSGRVPIGIELCTQFHTTPLARVLSAQGSTRVADGDLVLSVPNLVPGSSGYFITSDGNGVLVEPGGAWGNLCIHDPGGMGRHFESLSNSDAGGMFQFTVDLSAIPTPSGVTSVMVGETRYWQLWHRDIDTVFNGSNFSSAVGVTFN